MLFGSAETAHQILKSKLIQTYPSVLYPAGCVTGSFLTYSLLCCLIGHSKVFETHLSQEKQLVTSMLSWGSSSHLCMWDPLGRTCINDKNMCFPSVVSESPSCSWEGRWPWLQFWGRKREKVHAYHWITFRTPRAHWHLQCFNIWLYKMTWFFFYSWNDCNPLFWQGMKFCMDAVDLQKIMFICQC